MSKNVFDWMSKQNSNMVGDLMAIKVKPVEENGTETSVLSNMFAALILFLPNFLFLFKNIREGGIFYFMFYNFVIYFILVSGVSHFKFWSGRR